MSSALSAAAQDRKARLAALKSLKRKQPDEPREDEQDTTDDLPAPIRPDSQSSPTATTALKSPPTEVSSTYVSGRNYDASTRAPKLGFESDPSAQENTLEKQAQALAEQTKKQAEDDARDDKPLDLFKLQPKKPNWDLKRDLDKKLDVLTVRTDNAIARLVRERITAAQEEKKKLDSGVDKADGVNVGMEGAELIEATNLREKEDEEDARREREADADLLDGS